MHRDDSRVAWGGGFRATGGGGGLRAARGALDGVAAPGGAAAPSRGGASPFGDRRSRPPGNLDAFNSPVYGCGGSGWVGGIHVAVFPVGGPIPPVCLCDYAALVAWHACIDLASLRPSYSEHQKSSFTHQPWDTGCLRLKFVLGGEILNVILLLPDAEY
ncbi:hypothetical protein GUJ93_ZPchr0001g30698 [Zizania palustris]|uniref:Uncharacterized protein n=1 Tax=Zizania palustris TaxID=103762 RepID=A0A8J5RNT0_ZIZPA|nr:hypothetical protein GUJ93_ZPchr0001g30698 [Zizania palustris]